MDGVLIKYVALFIVLSLPAVVAGQADENTITGGNLLVIVSDQTGNPVSNALVKAEDSSGIPVLKQTDSNGRADLVIAKKSKITIKADGYLDWVSREPVSPNVTLMLVLESKNTDFHVIDTERKDVPRAFIIIEDPAGNRIVEQSDTQGMASARIPYGWANITVKAEGYNDFNAPLKAGNANYTFVLSGNADSKKIVWNIIALVLPFILMLFASLFKWDEDKKDNRKYVYTAGIAWVISFSVLTILAYITNDYYIYFLDSNLKVSLFVPIAAMLGAVSSITVSKLNKIEGKLPDQEWKSVYVGYGRRLLIAPYIAIIALFTITEAAGLKNPWAILFFAYFVGLYTKQIEGTLEEIGKKFLTEKQITELKKRDLKSSEIVKRLGVSISIAEKLDSECISEVSDLMAIPGTKIKDIADKTLIDEAYLSDLKDKAKKQTDSIEIMRKGLGIDHDTLGRLVGAGIYSKEDLAQISGESLAKIASNSGISEEKLKSLIDDAKKQVESIEIMRKELGIDHDTLSRLEDAGIYSKEDLAQISGESLAKIASNSGISEEELVKLVDKANPPGK
ncbi:MAG: hypothetical protein OIN66_05450 [Candidatus Methanoperedens sp.]|nr:hypothetical protein [Candidatus Methanoperedens sp.]